MSDYHAHPALSASKLKAALTRTPRQFWAQYGPDGTPLVPTDSMRQGSLVDCLLLTPERLEATYAVMPEGLNRTTKAGKAAYAELLASDREIIPAAWLTTATAICAALRADPDVAPLLEHACQQPHFWSDPLMGECRYMPDIEGPGLLVDLKKTASAHPRKFAAQAWDLAYDVQLAHYATGHLSRHGAMPERVGFLVYDWSPCPDYGIYWVTPDWLAIGETRRLQAYKRIEAYQTATHHRSYGIQNLTLPSYATIAATPEDF